MRTMHGPTTNVVHPYPLTSAVQLAEVTCQLVLAFASRQLRANSSCWQCWQSCCTGFKRPCFGFLVLDVFCLQSRHHWLLTVAAEGVVRLLYPLKYQHVYIPVMPSSLADYLEVRPPRRQQLSSS